ncbi:choline ABC transporter ATP-binding protein [Pseudochrobactrum kiredjianiae]|uniref:Choline ABC transporter ATP-binding protein n=1 Tax=Pseudochrobactrum kiredjianiae TaxID=386305 RepID=A0ABW3V2A7_9HYPH|nr:choline ABC transporter ATP-binding protein [Pseudochrobactrum kiredjianiae]MDM7850995.1 choline ABC transporter ATP-binding protein [Pseudochrobactrum kiredjianiae]
MASISLQNISIVFGNKTDRALDLADQGFSRTEIQEETGHILGVHNCSLDIREGELLVLMGLSGSGKSTLLRAINRLTPISRGCVTVYHDNQAFNVTDAGAKDLRYLRTHLISMVFQQFGLLPWRTVADNVGFGLEIAGLKKQNRTEAVAHQLELVGLQDWATRKVGELSGGMQQRVGLARAFATGAPILLMDEPFSALDPLIRARLQDELLHLQDHLKKTIVFVSHDLDEAMKLGNRIAIMEGGRIIQCGNGQDILSKPANDYVADFVANMNPLSVLLAADIMSALDRSAPPRPFAATAKPDTPIQDIMQAMVRNNGDVGVVHNGAIVGKISADDVVRSLTRHQR